MFCKFTCVHIFLPEKSNIMNAVKFYFLLFAVLFLSGNVLGSSLENEQVEINLSFTGEPFDTNIDDIGDGSRTLPLPFSASVMNNQSVVVNFYEAIGEVAITISTVDGQVLYQALENITSPQGLSISIPLTSEETLLLEFSNSKDAYASGVFTLSE